MSKASLNVGADNIRPHYMVQTQRADIRPYMRRIIIKHTKQCFCAGCSILMLLSLGACSTQSADSSVPPEIISNPGIAQEFTPPAPLTFIPPYLLSADQHLNLLLGAGCLSDGWASPNELSPNKIVDFYTALSFLDSRVPLNVPGAPKHPIYGSVIYEAYVEDVAAEYFGVSSDYVQQSDYYYAPGKGYAVVGIGSVAACAAQSVAPEDGGITIAFDMLWDGDPYATGELSLAMADDASWRYKSLVLNKDKPPAKSDALSLDDLCMRYVTPLIPTGGILIDSWNSPGEIAANDLIDFCAYNNLLQRERKDPSRNIAMGGEYVDPYADAIEVETAIQQYFDVSTDYLRSAKVYEYEGHTGQYLLPYGYGGSGRVRALGYEEKDGTLRIRVGILGGDSTMMMPSLTGILTLRIDEPGFKYLSYHLEK